MLNFSSVIYFFHLEMSNEISNVVSKKMASEKHMLLQKNKQVLQNEIRCSK